MIKARYNNSIKDIFNFVIYQVYHDDYQAFLLMNIQYHDILVNAFMLYCGCTVSVLPNPTIGKHQQYLLQRNAYALS